jgi:hypothetical protein
MSHEPHSSNAPTTIRKPYEPPQLKPLGSIVEMTQAAPGDPDDGGPVAGSDL